MEILIDFLRSDLFLEIIAVLNILLVILFFITILEFSRINKKYKKFIKKLGKGNNIEEDLQRYIEIVEEVQKQSKEVNKTCEKLNLDMKKCIQKVGMVRYSAFKDTGSDLSFALALLDENNSGVVLNGIYSREMSNIYAKPVENGKSKYTVSQEENDAIEKAIASNQFVK